MRKRITLENHFYSQYQASIQVESNTSGDTRKFWELLLLCSFSLRQMHNLQNIAVPLARVLCVVKPPIDAHYYYSPLLFGKTIEELVFCVPVIMALGVDVKKLIGTMTALSIYKAASKYSEEQIANEFWPNSPELVGKRISPGKKQFLGELHMQEKRAMFTLTPKGFGILGKGVNYYATVSVTLLLRYLANIHQDDYTFQKRLARVANFCGTAFLQNRVTTQSQRELPFILAVKAINDVVK